MVELSQPVMMEAKYSSSGDDEFDSTTIEQTSADPLTVGKKLTAEDIQIMPSDSQKLLLDAQVSPRTKAK